MKQNKRFLFPAFCAMLFILLTVILKTVDVGYVCGLESKVGLSHLNGRAHCFFGQSETWYEISEVTGLVAIACGGVFALIGVFQLIKRKSIFKVDREIILLGCLYAALAVIYVFFDKAVINCRPITAFGETAADSSFPSSHTVLAAVVSGSAIMLLPKYIKKNILRHIISALVCAVGVITVVGRLLSGVHWFTDILGSVFLSCFLLSLFGALIAKKQE